MSHLKQNKFIKQFILPNEFFKTRFIKLQRETSQSIIYNFRCPICGDSHTNNRKKRGYLIWKFGKPEFKFKCHNCGRSYDFSYFIKTELPKLGLDLSVAFRNYLGLDRLKGQETPTVEDIYKSFYSVKANIFSYVQKIEDNKVVMAYAENRKIPKKYWNEKVFAYSGTLYDFIKKDSLGIFDEASITQTYHMPDDYLVLVQEAFINGIVYPVGFSLRTIHNRELRYFKIPIKNKPENTFFSNILDYSDLADYPIFVLEGQIDSLMFNNPAIAMNNANLVGIEEIKELKENKKIYVFDNDYKTNPEIKKKMLALPISEKSVIWEMDKENKFKDCNAIVVNGYKEYPLDKYVISLLGNGLKRKLLLR